MALGVAGVSAAQSGGDTTNYPDGNGWTFDPVPTAGALTQPAPASTEGWSGTYDDDADPATEQVQDAHCTLLGSSRLDPITHNPIIPLCEIRNEYRPTELEADGSTPAPPAEGPDHNGNPSGSIWTVMTTVANAVGVLEGQGTWTSPSFALGSDAVDSATLAYDRLFEVDQLLAEKGSTARVVIQLVDQKATPNNAADDTVHQISSETLVRDNSTEENDTATGDTEAWIRRSVSVGTDMLKPGNSYRLKFTTFLTTEDAQLLLTNQLGVGYDNIRLSLTEPITGPTGPDGAAGPTGPTGPQGNDGEDGTDGKDGTDGTDGKDGEDGTDGKDGADGKDGEDGTDGKDGTDGANGTDGKDGAQGPQGAPGAQGAPGPAGPAGATGQPGREASVVNSDEARRLLTINRLQPFLTRGPFANQLRTRVFCRRGAERRCEGVVKIRTLNKVNTAFMPGRRVMKRVTLGTGAYRLNIGQIGYAKVFTTNLSRKIIGKRGPFKVEVLFTALDEDGGQQTLRRVFKLRKARR